MPKQNVLISSFETLCFQLINKTIKQLFILRLSTKRNQNANRSVAPRAGHAHFISMPLQRPHSEPKKQSTNIKNFAHSCHKQKEQKLQKGNGTNSSTKASWQFDLPPPTTEHHPLSNSHRWGVDSPGHEYFSKCRARLWLSHLVTRGSSLFTKNKKKRVSMGRWERVLFLGDPTIYAIFGKLFLCLWVQFASWNHLFFGRNGGGAGQKCAKFVGVVVYGAFELRYCLEVWFSILRLKKFQLLGSSTLRFLLNKLQCHRLCHAGTFPPSVCRFVMQKFSSQKGWV